MNSDSKSEIVEEHPGVVTTRRRLLLFAAVYLIGTVIATVFLTFGSGGGFSFFLETFVMVLVFLPCGLLVAVHAFLQISVLEEGPFPRPANAFSSLLLVLSYLSCIVIPAAGSRTKRQQTFGFLFLGFIALILINVAGCSIMR